MVVRSFLFLLACLTIASSNATAQVTVNLTTTQQGNCTATTDSRGLTLIPGSTNLQATGVTLTGDGCNTNGAGGGDFQAVLNVPASATAGTPVNITWSAGAAATQCTYGGATNLAGWPAGSSACQGSACAAAHTTTVTPASAGNYNINITCTNASGFKQGTLVAGAPALPPQPANFPLTATPAAPTVGTPFTVTWSVSGASSCAGTASLNNTPLASLPGWTDSNAATPQSRTINPTQAGTYSLQLNCSNAVGSTASQPLSVTVGVAGDSCPSAPLARFTNTSISYVPSSGIRYGVDLTSYDNIWGHASTTDTVATFPGRSNSQPAILDFPRNSYIAAKFHVPANAPSTLYGQITRTDYNYGADVTAAISTACGDFNVPLACITTGVAGAPMPRWTLAQTSTQCKLQPNTDYYLNIKYTNPAQGTGTCSASSPTCVIGTANNIGGQ